MYKLYFDKSIRSEFFREKADPKNSGKIQGAHSWWTATFVKLHAVWGKFTKIALHHECCLEFFGNSQISALDHL